MKNLITAMALAFTAVSAYATPSWLAVYTDAYRDKVRDVTYSGTANEGCYFAYYCSLSQAATLLGGTDISSITTYLTGNFAAAWESLAAASPKSTDPKDFASVHDVQNVGDAIWLTPGVDQFEFELGFGNPVTDASGFAVVLFDNGDESNRSQAFRVFDSDAAELANGYLAYDNPEGAQYAWTAVPEPTSALLLLLGVAGFALKRKRSGL